MKIADVVSLRALGNEWFETYSNLQPIDTQHPPSLKNPTKVVVPMPQDGWHKGDSKEARKKALQDIAEIHSRLRRQIGKPTISQSAIYPVFPNITTWT